MLAEAKRAPVADFVTGRVTVQPPPGSELSKSGNLMGSLGRKSLGKSSEGPMRMVAASMQRAGSIGEAAVPKVAGVKKSSPSSTMARGGVTVRKSLAVAKKKTGGRAGGAGGVLCARPGGACRASGSWLLLALSLWRYTPSMAGAGQVLTR